jgi:hypothetical protein
MSNVITMYLSSLYFSNLKFNEKEFYKIVYSQQC